MSRRRRNETEEQRARRELISNFLSAANIQSMDDIQELRKLIYTTNTIEGFNRQLKKVTKAKSVFPTDDSLFKMLYLAMKDITKKWTGRRQDWSRMLICR